MSDKAMRKSTKALKKGAASNESDEITNGVKDGCSADTLSCISSGEASSSIRGSEMEQEAAMAEQTLYYPANGVYGYYYPGSLAESEDNLYFVRADELDLQHSAAQSENESLVYYFPGYQAAYSPYGRASPLLNANGQYFTHLYQPCPMFHQPPISSGFIPRPITYGTEYFPTYIWHAPPISTAMRRNSTSSYRNLTHPLQNHTLNASIASGPPSALNLEPLQISDMPDQASNGVSKGVLQKNKCNSYPGPERTGLLVDARTAARANFGPENRKSDHLAQRSGNSDILNEQSRGLRTNGSRDTCPVVDSGHDFLAASLQMEEYNLANFETEYVDALFFVIKSYSEDDVHKSIKYGVWASTANGNKRLDNAYQLAQEKAEEKGSKCPVFLFFSVNTSGQFCGVAEMIGQVDFKTKMEFWQQDKWNGCFPLKWHIIKDIPNLQFRHIILENNDNKSVTNSRDTQEVKFPQGTQMLNIFKNYIMKYSIFDYFCLYENKEKAMLDKRNRLKSEHTMRKTGSSSKNE